MHHRRREKNKLFGRKTGEFYTHAEQLWAFCVSVTVPVLTVVNRILLLKIVLETDISFIDEMQD
jgi:hypothetical protein